MDGELSDEQQERAKDETAAKAAMLLEVRERADDAVTAWQPIFDAARTDARMIAGDQWPSDVKAERSGRVCLTINQYPKFIRQVTSDAKQKRISIKVKPQEFDRSPKVRGLAGTRDYSLAELMEGYIRTIENNSSAQDHYDRAMEQAIKGGFGWLRVLKRYAQPDGFEQELYITSVRSPYSVLVDPRALQTADPGISGGDYFFVHEWVPKKVARRLYGEAASDTTLGDGINPKHGMFWVSDRNIRVSEYWWRETVEERYVLLSTGAVMRAAEFVAAQQQNKIPPEVTVARERVGIKYQVKWMLTNGCVILDGPHDWDGGLLPIAAVLGPEHYLDDEGVRFDSLVRHSHDAQRNFNYWQSNATERVALAPKARWMGDAASIAGFEDDYKSNDPQAILRYRFREGVPKPELVQGSTTAAAELTMALTQNDNIKSTMGIFDASLGNRSNETSGVAIQQRQREGDAATYDWHDAQSKAVRQVGRILVDLVPKVIDTERLIRITLPDDSGEDFVTVNQTVEVKDEAGNVKEEMVVADLSAARVDIVVDTGPALSTRRQEAAESMTQFVQAVPAAGQVMADIVAESMDWPGAERAARRLRSLVPQNLLTQEERDQLASGAPQEPQEPTPEDQVAIKELEARLAEAEAKIAEAEAKAAQAKAMDPDQVKELVADAIAEVIASVSSGNR